MAAAQGRARRGPHLHSLADSTTSESLHKGQRAPLGWPAMEGHWLRLSSEREQNNSWEPSLVIPNWFLSAKKSVRLAPPAAVEQRCGVSALADAKERKKGERERKREKEVGWKTNVGYAVRSPLRGKTLLVASRASARIKQRLQPCRMLMRLPFTFFVARRPERSPSAGWNMDIDHPARVWMQ